MSWRHAGPCARAKAAQDYVRIKEALGRFERQNIVYMVLTLDPSAWTGEGWAGWKGKTPERRPDATNDGSAIAAAYSALCDRWKMLAQALRRRWGQFEYVATVESHRSGWPHLNVVMVAPALAADIRQQHQELDGWGRKAAGREAARRALGDILERAGFGRIAFIESALALESDGEDRLAAYVAKLAGETGSAWDGQARGLIAAADDAPAGAVVHSIEGHTVGEIAKLSQAPVRAPEHFRRLRSSPGFLPAVIKDEDLTGALFDERGEPVGRDQGDTMVSAAERADTPQAREDLARQIGALVDKYQERNTFEDEKGAIVRVRQARIVAKLYRALRILDGIDARQLLDQAIAARSANEKARVLEAVERELERHKEHQELVKLNKELCGCDDRPAVMLTGPDVKRLRDAKLVLTGELEVDDETPSRRVLSPDIAREIRSQQDCEAFVSTFAHGPAMRGPAARRYVLGDRYYG